MKTTHYELIPTVYHLPASLRSTPLNGIGNLSRKQANQQKLLYPRGLEKIKYVMMIKLFVLSAYFLYLFFCGKTKLSDA